MKTLNRVFIWGKYFHVGRKKYQSKQTPHKPQQCLKNINDNIWLFIWIFFDSTCTLKSSISLNLLDLLWICILSISFQATWQVSLIFIKYYHLMKYLCYITKYKVLFKTWFITHGLPFSHISPFQPARQLPLQLPVFLWHLPWTLQVILHVLLQLYPYNPSGHSVKVNIVLPNSYHINRTFYQIRWFFLHIYIFFTYLIMYKT